MFYICYLYIAATIITASLYFKKNKKNDGIHPASNSMSVLIYDMGILNNERNSQKTNKLSLETLSEETLKATKSFSNNGSLKSIPSTIYTSPLLLNKQSTVDGNNIVLPSISALKNHLSNNSERTATSPRVPYMQYKNISPIAESKVRTTIERPQSFSSSHRGSISSENSAANIDKSYFQPLLPPSAIPIKSSQGSITEDTNPFFNQRKSSLSFSNNIFNTPVVLPSLMFPTPFLNPQSPLIFPNTFPDSIPTTNNNVLPPITPKFSLTGDSSITMKKSTSSVEKKMSSYVIPEASLPVKQVYKKNTILMNYDLEKAMQATKQNIEKNTQHGSLKAFSNRAEIEDVMSPLELPTKSTYKPSISSINKIKKKNIKKVQVKQRKQDLHVLANTRSDNRQRAGSSCNLCQFKKCKCDAKIEVLIQDEKIFKLHKEIRSDDNDANLHFLLDFTNPKILNDFKKWMIEKNINIPKDIKVLKESQPNDIKYYKHLNTIIKITSCSNCIDYQVGCYFKYGYSKEDKRLCYKLNLKVKNTYLEEKEKYLKGNVSQLPTESCYLGKLTVSDYYKLLGL